MFGRGKCYKKLATTSSSESVDNLLAAAAKSFCHVVLHMADADVPKFLLMQSGQESVRPEYKARILERISQQSINQSTQLNRLFLTCIKLGN